MDLVSAPYTEKRHAYIRNVVREQNEGSTLNHSRLDPLGQADQNSNDSNPEESEYEVQISIGFDGTVKHKKAKKINAKKMTFEERLRAEVREAMSAQGRAVTDDWMERFAEHHFGSSAFFAPDSDDEGVCEEKETAAEIHAIKYYGGEAAVNHQGLSCTALLEQQGLTTKI